MEFSDHIIYLDESGDHGLVSVDPNYPLFVLALCVFKKADYAALAVPAVQNFKFKWFGHDLVVLHESDVVKRKGAFGFLQFDDKRAAFMDELSALIQAMPMTVIAAVIDKAALKTRYPHPLNPYELALLFCVEKAFELLTLRGDAERRTHIVCESRSPRTKDGKDGREDAALKAEFQRIVAARNPLSRVPMPCLDIVFASKQANSAGLQIADLVARPIGIHVLRPGQKNRAYDIIKEKLFHEPPGSTTDGRGSDGGLGFKLFP